MAVVRPDIKYTYADYRALPETGPRCQLLDGELVMSPAPSLRHQDIVARLLAALLAFVTPRRLGKVYVSPVDVILSNSNVPQPDVVYVSNSRAGILAKEGVRGAPDLCVEVLSPSTAPQDRGPKKVLYARYGVTEYWIVDPEAATIEIYRLEQDPEAPERTLGSTDTLTTALLPGFSLSLRELFAP